MKNKNHIKQFCAFFLAVCMVLEAFVLPGIGSVFAQKTDGTDPAAETSIEIVTDDTTGDNTEIDVDDTTEDGARDTVDSTVGDVTDENEEDTTDETTGEATEETTGDGADETTGDITDETTGAAVDETTGDVTDETMGAATDETVGDNTGDVTDETTGAAAGDVTEETTGAAAGDVTEETTGAVAGDGTENGAGGAAGGTVETGAAGAAGGTLEVGTPPNAQPANKPTKIDSACPWEDMTDERLAEWLLDETNEEKIKKVLSDEDSDDYFSLRDRIEMILDGEDVELASKVYERLLTLGMAMGIMAPIATYANAEKDPYIYFDLAAGNVTIGKSGYNGYVFVNGEKKEVQGSHLDDNKYYIYQSTAANKENTGYKDDTDYGNRQDCRVPNYDRVQQGGQLWGDYVTNNTDVYTVSKEWEKAATESKREGTPNNITFKSESGYTADVTIDNIWSTHHKGKNTRTTGGIGANLKNNNINCTNTKIQLWLKGDNRVGCVHYSSGEGANNKIIFSDWKDDPKGVSLYEEVNAEHFSLEKSVTDDWALSGSITVADFEKDFKGNYWSSAIGAADDPPNVGDCADGIVINSGVIFAGTTSADDSTAIGGGGNNFGGVTITGGTVTAVAASTGTAIGGGIGWGSPGGNANVLISGGTVYAYNDGIGSDSGSYTSYVPAVAIGGGSGDKAAGNAKTTVTITGGRVYAQSVGGAAIGGGGSGTGKGGDATVKISGGTVIAKSIGGEVTYTKTGKGETKERVSRGVSIGGGTGKTGGGSVTLNVSGEKTILRTGSIGGGMTTQEGKPVGSANVTISGGDITGQVIMAGGASKNCSFVMSGGRIHGTDVIKGNKVVDTNGFDDPQPDVPILYLEQNGGAVWMQDTNGATNISGGTIEDCTAQLGGAVYMEGGTFTLSGSGTIQNNKALRSEDIKEGEIQGYGGGAYVTGGSAVIEGGSVYNNDAQVRGGGLYVKGGDVTVKGGSISGNIAGSGTVLPNNVGRGGGVYLESGRFTMEGGIITGNKANYRGGGIFLTQSPVLNAGEISGNTAKDSGGGLCINGDTLELKSPNMLIYGNTANEKGGGVAVLNGSFTLSGGAVGVEKASPNNAKKGGGVYVEQESTSTDTSTGASVTVGSGNIWYNRANEGGGVYLAKGKGTFTLDGENASINNNTATNGGGIYLHGAPTLNKGTITSNSAEQNGGGMCIQDCLVVLKPTGTVSITDNHAGNNGAGIYIHDSSIDNTAGTDVTNVSSTNGNSGESGSDDPVDAVSSTTPLPENGVGLLVEESTGGHINFTNNTATQNGGAVCIDKGRFYLYSDNVTITGNKAANGGGVAVLKGNFTMTKGSIGQENAANTADKGGGGVYVSGGDVWLKGGNVKYNGATNGGGICVENGKIYMYGGEVNENKASNDGGGLYASTDKQDPLVDILSGSVSDNTAGENGGGVAVVSKGDGNIKVNVGINAEHPKLNLDTGSFEPFRPLECGDAHDKESHQDHWHSSCPVVEGNTARGSGGGFFLDSPKSHITIYCLVEKNNTAESDSNSQCMDVKGGIVRIGDEDFDIHVIYPTSEVKGNTIMQGSIMVEGGQVDVYGKMENPRFIDDVKVDVKGTTDHYLDHRIIKTEHVNYKVHYYENFKGDGNTPTGLYIAKQYPDEEHANFDGKEKYNFTIMSSIFSHPGYKIVGWDKDPNGLGDDFNVNETYNLEELKENGDLGSTPVAGKHEDEYLLVIYAIWERKSYVLEFNPNVGVGETYTGTMEKQRVTMGQLDGTQTISENAFKRTGYQFLGWTLKPAPADDDRVYKDGQKITEDFTDVDGATITLYAKWKRCEHIGYLTYTANENVLTQSCTVCGGHTATATISAVDCDYDGKEHLATVKFSSNWLEKKPEISYEMAENTIWDDVDDIDDNWLNNPKPLHAGEYTAKITAKDIEDKDVTAQTKYTISPVKWETPDVPEISFTVKKGDDGVYKSIIGVTKPIGKNVMYKITYLPYGGEETDVDDYKDWQTNNEFTNIPIGKYYYFYAKICADRDHLESDHSKSTAYLTSGGNIIYIEKGNGIKVEPGYGTGVFKYTVSAEEGYHLREYKDNLPKDATITSISSEIAGFVEQIPGAESQDAFIQDDSIIITKSKSLEGTYEYVIEFVENKVAFHQITLKFSGAAKDASVTSKVTDGQVFSDFNSKATSISRDSAFTAQFTVKDYIPDEYEKQELGFSQELPAGTTVIMKTEGGYWYYKFGTAGNSINLKDFAAMGGNDKFEVDTTDTDPKDFTYQFIVDFSRATGNAITDSLEVNLNLTPNKSHSAPTIPAGEQDPHISLDIKKEAVFTLTSSVTDGKTATINCEYNPSDGAASIWNGRKAALVLTAPDTAPADLTLTAVVDGKTTRYTMNEKGKFIIPLGEIGTKEVKITPDSYLFDSSEKELAFTVNWYVSQGAADRSPLYENSDPVESCNVTFSCKKDLMPSVRIEGTKRLCQVGGQLSVKVYYKNIPSEGKVTAYLQRKNNGNQYLETGANSTVLEKTDAGREGNGSVTFSMGQMDSGSYRILVIVEESSGAYVLQVPYYFLIE